MQELTSGQRKQLRSLAHHLSPVGYVGKNGLTEAVVAAVDEALEDHELIKVKFNDHKDEKREISADLAERTASHVVGIIGNIAILFRYQHNPEKRKINLE